MGDCGTHGGARLLSPFQEEGGMPLAPHHPAALSGPHLSWTTSSQGLNMGAHQCLAISGLEDFLSHLSSGALPVNWLRLVMSALGTRAHLRGVPCSNPHAYFFAQMSHLCH